jgi:upstream activation factor subunit UAF30
MAKFTGFDPKVQHSRVDVTKFLCKYIKDKNLQNPVNKREINADPALSKLLNYDPKTSVPLTYPSMQKLLKNHFAKPQ